jgi:hypothetical protein
MYLVQPPFQKTENSADFIPAVPVLAVSSLMGIFAGRFFAAQLSLFLVIAMRGS